jgi:MFS superfamily sulfate permease-like transporter
MKRLEDSNKFEDVVVIRDLNIFKNKHNWYDVGGGLDKGVLIVRIEESLYFANVGQLKELFQKLELLSETPLFAIVINCAHVSTYDASALQALREMVEDWKKRQVVVCFVKVRTKHRALWMRSGLLEVVDPSRLFSKIQDALQYIHDDTKSGYST